MNIKKIYTFKTSSFYFVVYFFKIFPILLHFIKILNVNYNLIIVDTKMGKNNFTSPQFSFIFESCKISYIVICFICKFN